MGLVFHSRLWVLMCLFVPTFIIITLPSFTDFFTYASAPNIFILIFFPIGF